MDGGGEVLVGDELASEAAEAVSFAALYCYLYFMCT